MRRLGEQWVGRSQRTRRASHTIEADQVIECQRAESAACVLKKATARNNRCDLLG
jgi:hypothetical protein